MGVTGSLLDYLLAGREVSLTARVKGDGSDFEGVATVKIKPHSTSHEPRLDVSLYGVKGEPKLDKLVSLSGEVERMNESSSNDRIELPRCLLESRSSSTYDVYVPSIRVASWPPRAGEKKPRLRRWLLSSTPWGFVEGNRFQYFMNGSVVLDSPRDPAGWALDQLHYSLAPRSETFTVGGRKHSIRYYYTHFHPRRLEEERRGTIVEVHRTLAMDEAPEASEDPFNSDQRAPARLRRVLSYLFETHVGVDIAVDYFGELYQDNVVHISAYAPRTRREEGWPSFPLPLVGYDLPLVFLKALEECADGALVEKAMELAAESRDHERPAQARFYSAFVALESLAGALADEHALVKAPRNRDYDTIRHVIEEALEKIEDMDVRSNMKSKIPELKRPPLSATLSAVFQKYAVKVDDLWPKETTPEAGLKAIAKMRNEMFHAGKEPEKETDLLHAEQRLRIIFDRLLLQILGAREAAEGYEKGAAYKVSQLQSDSFFAEIS